MGMRGAVSAFFVAPQHGDRQNGTCSVLKSASHPAVLLVVRPRLRHQKERALRRVRLNGKIARDYGFKALPHSRFASPQSRDANDLVN